MHTHIFAVKFSSNSWTQAFEFDVLSGLISWKEAMYMLFKNMYFFFFPVIKIAWELPGDELQPQWNTCLENF